MSLTVQVLTALIKCAYDFIRPAGYTVLAEFPKEFGWILQDRHNQVIVVVRGTETIEDWVNNAQVDLVKTLYGKLHRGFHDMYEELLPTLVNVAKTLPAETTYCFTGHSLGAPIATFLATALVSGRHSNGDSLGVQVDGTQVRLELFASPHPGADSFWAFFSRLGIRTFRYRNKHDIVNYVPVGPHYCHICPPTDFKELKVGNIKYMHTITTYQKALVALGY